MTGDRPAREVIFGMVFDTTGHLRGEVKPRLESITCRRRDHRLGWSLRTPYGWWVVWRQVEAEHERQWRWECDWADQIGGYELATCHCGRTRNIGPIARRMR